MADKRINALTTTSASVGDDYFAIDGATNGTRALSAFNPTFGGSLTVSAMISAGNQISTAAGLVCQNADVTGGYMTLRGFGSQDAGLIFLGQSTNNNYISSNATTIGVTIANTGITQTVAAGLRVLTSTASTSTSSGALVVSGGLGLAGNLNMGGSLSVAGGSGISLDTTGSASLRFNDGASTKWWIYKLNGDTNLYYRDMVNSRMQMVMVPGADSQIATTALYSKFSVDATTASTSTSSGALVVSGGVGVAGAIYAGGDIAIPADKGLYLKQGNVQKWTSDGTPTGTSRADIYADSGGAFFVRTGGATQALTISSSGNATFASTTNASSTSFAALVVSGGVGVAKRIVSGEGLTTNGDNETQITFTRNGTISIGPTSAATPKLAVGGGLQLSNTSQSIPAWGDVGAQLSIAGAVITDTTSSGTVSRFVSNSISASSIAASSPTTYTQAATLFIAAGPTANTNVTITNSYALFIAGGRINFGGLPTSSAGLQAGTLWNDGGTLKVA